jgi:hypothetical protein
MRAAGICPMPMMMHHDTQPLYSPGTNYGLINQVKLLRKAGAVSLQVLMMTPSVGTKLYDGTFTDGLVLKRVGGREVRPYMYDGNYVIASKHARPWRKQLNMLLAYAYFYNPLWLLVAVMRHKTKVGGKPAWMQVIGMLGLIQTIRRTSGWALRLMFQKVERLTQPPGTSIPMRGPRGEEATHAPVLVTVSVPSRSRRDVALPVAG